MEGGSAGDTASSSDAPAAPGALADTAAGLQSLLRARLLVNALSPCSAVASNAVAVVPAAAAAGWPEPAAALIAVSAEPRVSRLLLWERCSDVDGGSRHMRLAAALCRAGPAAAEDADSRIDGGPALVRWKACGHANGLVGSAVSSAGTEFWEPAIERASDTARCDWCGGCCGLAVPTVTAGRPATADARGPLALVPAAVGDARAAPPRPSHDPCGVLVALRGLRGLRRGGRSRRCWGCGSGPAVGGKLGLKLDERRANMKVESPAGEPSSTIKRPLSSPEQSEVTRDSRLGAPGLRHARASCCAPKSRPTDPGTTPTGEVGSLATFVDDGLRRLSLEKNPLSFRPHGSFVRRCESGDGEPPSRSRSLLKSRRGLDSSAGASGLKGAVWPLRNGRRGDSSSRGRFMAPVLLRSTLPREFLKPAVKPSSHRLS